MSLDPVKNALYCQGTFDVENPTQQQMQVMLENAADIAASGFGTVLLGQWHVHPDGTIYYNDSPLDTVTENVSVISAALKATGSSVQKVLISFGPFLTDFSAIQSNYASFTATMGELYQTTAVDGFDWDIEAYSLQEYAPYESLIVNLTQWATGLGCLVTAAPFNVQQFWQQVIAQTNTPTQTGFAWWNLQTYGGASYAQWVSYLAGLVADPASFLVPGFTAEYASPTAVQQQLASDAQSNPTLSGGFIWQYEWILKSGYTVSQFASAVANGVGGVPTAVAR
jgi:hypothetical protein